MPFTIERTSIPEVLFVRPQLFRDDRGWFTEVLRTDAFAELGLGLPTRFEQVNQSRSERGVIRGLHFQWDPPQGKLMRVVSGRAFVVAVDIRPGSPTLGKHVSLEASGEEPVLFWAPATFARGFAVLSDIAEIEYFCTAPYNPAAESGIRWDDPALGIEWPVAHAQLSPKDAAAGTLQEWLASAALHAFRPVSAAGDHIEPKAESGTADLRGHD
ncbi:MAG TPA: dTDP-4-dehydrorhamnose 3,5-epimerase [Armatimonadota bacterium]